LNFSYIATKKMLLYNLVVILIIFFPYEEFADFLHEDVLPFSFFLEGNKINLVEDC